jgi:hypothetical protein
LMPLLTWALMKYWACCYWQSNCSALWVDFVRE